MRSADDERIRAARNTDDQFAWLAERIPGFGGFYFDPAGTPVVVLTREANRGRAVEVLQRAFGADPVSLPGGLRAPNWAGARVQIGQNEFRDLQYWRRRATEAIFAVPGVTLLDIDERKNRLRVGVRDAAAVQAVHGALARIGVPAGVAVVDRVEPARYQQTLSDPATTIASGPADLTERWIRLYARARRSSGERVWAAPLRLHHEQPLHTRSRRGGRGYALLSAGGRERDRG